MKYFKIQNKLSLHIILISFIWHFVSAQYDSSYYSSSSALDSFEFSSECPIIRTSLFLNISAFAGIWFKSSNYGFNIVKEVRCESILCLQWSEKSLLFDANQFSELTGEETNLEGFIDRHRDGKLKIRFHSDIPVDIFYWAVLDTDYVQYAVIYSCVNEYGSYAGSQTWVLTRKRFPTADVLALAYLSMATFGLEKDQLIPVNQTNCPTPNYVNRYHHLGSLSSESLDSF